MKERLCVNVCWFVIVFARLCFYCVLLIATFILQSLSIYDLFLVIHWVPLLLFSLLCFISLFISNSFILR